GEQVAVGSVGEDLEHVYLGSTCCRLTAYLLCSLFAAPSGIALARRRASRPRPARAECSSWPIGRRRRWRERSARPRPWLGPPPVGRACPARSLCKTSRPYG